MIVKEALEDILRPKSKDEIENELRNLSDEKLVRVGLDKKDEVLLLNALSNRQLDSKVIYYLIKE